MNIHSWSLAVLVPVVWLTSQSLFASVDPSCDACALHAQEGVGDELEIIRLAEALLPMLPEAEQAKILSSDWVDSESDALGMTGVMVPYTGEGTVTLWLTESMERLGDHSMTDLQVVKLFELSDAVDAGVETMPLCFAPGTNSKYVWLINQMLFPSNPNAFQQIGRWQRTAINGPGLSQGDPTIITYSYVADGTFIPNAGFGSGNSQLFAWLDSTYGSTEAWQDLFTQVFDRWSELTGTTYVYEPNDDGSTMLSFTGEVGIRGDVRIGAMGIDGDSGVLGFNSFPDNGDMVLDSFDSFYNNTVGNSRGLRNVIAHELGHGLGMAHVCPFVQTKLMEPFISFAFDGPQLDDILNGHRHYGDPQEPNDVAAMATDLGSMNINETLEFENASIDDTSDVDFYKLTLDAPSLITFTASPDAATYLQGPQTELCDADENTNSVINYNSVHDLQLKVYNSDDLLNPIFTSVSGFPGSPETMIFPGSEARDYFFEVIGASGNENVQLYRIDVSTSTLLAITGNIPTFLDPGLNNSFAVTLNPFEQTVEPGTELLFYRSAPGPYTSVPLVSTEGLEYLATLPGFECDPGTEIEFYIEASTIGSNAIFTLPLGGASDPFTAFIGEPTAFFADNFQSELGWVVSGSVVGQNAGQWERGVPAGDGSRGDPTVDGDGSGVCYLTGNGGPGSNTDVDGGDTVLNSPLFDISDVDRPNVSYWRWYDNTGSGIGSGASEDFFIVEASDDGGLTWFMIEIIGGPDDTAQASGGWFFVEIDLLTALAESPEFDFTTSQLQFRFIAEDLVNASVIEAGIDGVSVNELVCQDPQPIISLAMEPASEVSPGEDYVFEVFIDEPVDTVVPGSEMLAYFPADMKGVGVGGFIEVPLVSNGGNSYTATIPAQDCNPNHDQLPAGVRDVSYYIIVEGVSTGVTTFPDLNTEALLGINIGDPMLVLEESFELDSGWFVSGGAKSPVDGVWERGVPLGDGSRGDPTVDGDGSGSCYVTGNTVGATSSDVDTLTILNSPIFDVSGLIAPRMSYYHWYDNTGAGTGPAPDSDVMEIGISYDGGESFQTLGIIGPNTSESEGGWFMSDLALDLFQEGTSSMQIRFLVSDQGTGSVIEAGIDGVTISGLICEDVVLCLADIAGNKDGSPDGLLNFFDVSAFLNLFRAGDPAADLAGNQDGSPDGMLNFADISAFLASFSAGCP